MTRTLHTRRGGFTLIEVLVAAGLSMLIMAVVTQAFSRGIDTLSQLKSVTEMSQRLRTFEGIMRSDLAAEHFEGRGGTKVSDQQLNKLIGATVTNDTVTWRPPAKGFFSIRQESLSTREGMDADLNISSRAANHILQFTVRANPVRGDKVFTAQLPAGTMTPAMTNMSLSQMANQSNAFASSWAEVTYFLDTTDTSLGQTPGGLPLYGLYRRVRVIPEYGNPNQIPWNPVMTGASTAADSAAAQGISFSPRNVSGVDHPINDPASVRNPLNRLGGINATRNGGIYYDMMAREKDSNGAPTGNDLLLCDVISFEIKADWDFPPGDPASSMYLRPGTTGPNPNMYPQFDLSKTFEFPFSDLPLAVQLPTGMNPPSMNARNTLIGPNRVFDTWYDTPNNNWVTAGNRDTVPLPIRLRAVQIKVRVWDRNNNMARQVTIIQDL